MNKIDCVYKNMKEMGITLPNPPEKGNAVITIAKPFINEKMLYISGCGCTIAGKGYFGKIGKNLTVSEGGLAAKNAILNILAAIEHQIEDLNKIKSFVKLLVFVSSDDEFYEQPTVANSATELLIDLFGEEVGSPARSAIGCIALPGNIAVEIEALVEIE